MSSIELKPCPFCGGEAIISRNDLIIKRKSQRCAWVYCQKCGAKTPYYMRSNFEHYMRSAIEAWNRRSDNNPIRQSCKSCKHYAPDPNYRDGDMGNCRYLEKIWEKPFYVNEARAECEHFQAAERINENGNEINTYNGMAIPNIKTMELCGRKRMKQIRSKERVNKFAEVFTAPREVKAMCDLVDEECRRIESTFLEPACGTGNFLVEILERKFSSCKTIDDGLTAISSIFGIDIQGDNVLETRERLLKMFVQRFPYASMIMISAAKLILAHNIVQNNALELSPHDIDIWAQGGVLPVYKDTKMDEEEHNNV